jgi:hypothetical protein
MRYDKLEWGKKGVHPPEGRSISQELIRIEGCDEPSLHWAAYRVVHDISSDKFLLRCYRNLGVNPVDTCHRIRGITDDECTFNLDIITLACLLVHLEPAEKR